MLFFYDDDLKLNKIYLKNEVNNLIDYFTNMKNSLTSKHSLLLNYMENITTTIDNIQNTKDIKDTNILFTLLDKIKCTFNALDLNTQKINNLIKKVNDINSLLDLNLINDSLFSNIDELNILYDTYKIEIMKNDNIFYDFLRYYLSNCMFDFGFTILSNENNDNTTEKISDYNNTINTNTEIDTQKVSEQINIVSDKNEHNENQDSEKNLQDTPNDDSNIELTDNNILIISEKDNVAYLPYKITDIKKIFDNNKDLYTNLQDVINSNYIISLNRFKNPIIARFREAFSLMKNKEHSSLPKALDLALELSFNSLLNPVIICACKNLDELDIYLDFLETNELDKFDIFEIKYEVTPQVSF